MSDGERMDALTQANVRLLNRVAELERRIEFIERHQGVRGPVPAAPPSMESPSRETAATLDTQLPQPEPPAPTQPPELPRHEAPSISPGPPPLEGAVTEPPQPLVQPQAVETRIGLTWLNRVAVLTCILAVAFFFKYAVDNEWIGPAGRVALGVLAGMGCLGAADTLWRRGHQIYAQGLCGLGIAILYLSFQASFAFYHLLPQSAAFVLMFVVTAAAGALALRYASLAIAVLGLLGGYATPVLLSTGEKRLWFLFSYVLLLNIGALALGRFRNWRVLEAIALTGTTVLFFGGVDGSVGGDERTPAGVFTVLYWALFLTTPTWVVVYLAHFLAGVAALSVWEQGNNGFPVAILGLTAGMLAVGDRRNWPAAPSVAFTTFWFCYAVWITSLRGGLALSTEVAMITAAFGLFFSWTPWRILARRAQLTQRDLVLIAANAIFYGGRMYTLLEDEYSAWRGLGAVALAAVHLALGRFLWSSQPEGQRDKRPVLLLLGVAIVLLTLAAPVQFASYRITMAWALEGAALSWIAARTQSKPLTAGALVVLLLTLIRLTTVDYGIYPRTVDHAVLLNARLLTFLISAGAFWFAAKNLHEAWPREASLSVPPYVLGHGVLLLGLILEVSDWAMRAAAPENVRNLTSAMISIAAAIYAVALAVLGIAARSRLNRILGLALIGFVVLKLYLYDVWELRLLFRVLAFAGLGGLLLVMSFLYSRYRSSIESWLQDENRSAG